MVRQILDSDISIPAILGLPLQCRKRQATTQNPTPGIDLDPQIGEFQGFQSFCRLQRDDVSICSRTGKHLRRKTYDTISRRATREDNRTGLRVGSIQGHILPPNPLSLPAAPPGATEIFGANVVTVDDHWFGDCGGLDGWSCTTPGPVQFNRNYGIDQLPVSRSYKIYAKPLNGAVVTDAIVALRRNARTDPGWPPLQCCVVPDVNTVLRLNFAEFVSRSNER
jgi:hypothetical protein